MAEESFTIPELIHWGVNALVPVGLWGMKLMRARIKELEDAPKAVARELTEKIEQSNQRCEDGQTAILQSVDNKFNRLETKIDGLVSHLLNNRSA